MKVAPLFSIRREVLPRKLRRFSKASNFDLREKAYFILAVASMHLILLSFLENFMSMNGKVHDFESRVAMARIRAGESPEAMAGGYPSTGGI